MRHLTTVIVLLALGACVVVGVFVVGQLRIRGTYAPSPIQITIGLTSIDSSGLIWIAQEQGYFGENALDVTTSTFESRKLAVSGLMDGIVEAADRRGIW